MRLMKFKLLRCAVLWLMKTSKKEKEHVEGFQDVWAFDRLPYADLARNSSPEMDKISEDKDSSIYLLDTATKAKEDGNKLNWN